MSKKTQVWLVILVVLIVLGSILIIKIHKNSGSTTVGTQKEKVVVQAGWLLNGEFANVCSAIVNGYYDKQGLDVELKPGGPVGASFIIATNTLAQDPNIDIAIDGDLVPLVRGVTKQNPNEQIKAKAFAAFWEKSPLGFIVRDDSGISSIKDFIKTKPTGQKYKIGVTSDSILPQAIAAYLGVPQSSLDIVIVGYDATPFLDGQVDALQAFWTTQAYEVQKAGIKYKFLGVQEIPGFDQPSQIALATDKTLSEKSGMLAKWLTATIQGSKFNEQNPEESAKQITDPRCGGPAFDPIQEEWLIKQSLPLLDPNKIGWIYGNQVVNFAEGYQKLGQIPYIPKQSDLIDYSILDKVYNINQQQ
jgi:ABC-type nitrate/sulfonate/bicarbonate transport system substrate-binding protein